MGLDLRKVIGPKANNTAASISELKRLFSNVLGTVATAYQTLRSNLYFEGGDSQSKGSYNIIRKVVNHTTTAAATNTIDIDVPVGARIIGAQVIVTTALAFTGDSTAATLTWTTSGETVGSALAAQNTKGSALFDYNAATAIVSGSVETMTLDANNTGGLDAGGVIKVVAYYEDMTDLSDV